MSFINHNKFVNMAKETVINGSSNSSNLQSVFGLPVTCLNGNSIFLLYEHINQFVLPFESSRVTDP